MQQENMYQSQNSIMPQPPQFISTKDAMYLTDMLSWNLLAMKKANFYAQHCQDEEIIVLMNKCGQMHQKHYSLILKHLDSGQRTN